MPRVTMPKVPEGGWVLVNGAGSITDPSGRKKPYAGAWGYGKTVAAAKAAARRGGGFSPRWGYQVLVFGPDSTFEGVDEFGRYYVKGAEAVADVVVPPADR